MKCLGINYHRLSKPCRDAYDEYNKFEGAGRKRKRGSPVATLLLPVSRGPKRKSFKFDTPLAVV